MSRYARHLALPEIGAAGQARLARTRVLVAGAGGLAASVLPLLVGAGVGEVRLADPDVVEESNLHRQTLFRLADLGRPKARAAAGALAGLNPGCRLVPRDLRLDPVSAAAEMAGVDLVLDAADSGVLTYALSDLCHAAGVPLVAASVLGRAGHVGGFCGGAPSYRAVFPTLGAGATCASGGVMGPAVAALGALQAQMALSVLLGHAPSPLGQAMSVDLAGWSVRSFRFDRAPEPGPGPVVLAPGQVGAGDAVFDLRAPGEGAVFAGAARLAPEAVARIATAGRAVFVCATGTRAWRAAEAHLARGAASPPGVIAAG